MQHGPAEEQPAPTGDSLVLSVQQALAASGFYDGPVDGLMGPRTRAAIFDFEERAGRPGTGAPSMELLKAVHEAANAPTGSLPDDAGGAVGSFGTTISGFASFGSTGLSFFASSPRAGSADAARRRRSGAAATVRRTACIN